MELEAKSDWTDADIVSTFEKAVIDFFKDLYYDESSEEETIQVSISKLNPSDEVLITNKTDHIMISGFLIRKCKRDIRLNDLEKLPKILNDAFINTKFKVSLYGFHINNYTEARIYLYRKFLK